jgi:type VI secretion system secreted protein Hcp
LFQAFDHLVYIPRHPQTGASTGKRVHDPLTIIKVYDKSSPKLYQALTSGEKMTTVEIKWYRIDPKGSEEHYFTTNLQDAIIVSMNHYMPNCLDPSSEAFTHMEKLSFTYSKIKWVWVPDGTEAEDDWNVPRS